MNKGTKEVLSCCYQDPEENFEGRKWFRKECFGRKGYAEEYRPVSPRKKTEKKIGQRPLVGPFF